MSSIQELILKGTSLLKDKSHPALEAKSLLMESLSINEEEIYAHPDRKVSRFQERQFDRLISERLAGFPLAYLTGKKEFWSISFNVSPGVLIPRPETELLVEKVLELSSNGKETLVDLGTGCGNVAISLAKEMPQAKIFATDISAKAIKIAKSNAFQQRITNVVFVHGDMCSPLKKLGLLAKFDFVVSNPPYVSEKEWIELNHEISTHEPKKALVAGETGLEAISQIIRGAPPFMKAGGYLLLEIGDDQRQDVLSLFDSRWTVIDVFQDLMGIDRVILAQKT